MAKAQLLLYTTKDVEEAKKLFTSLLGTEPYIEGPDYVGYRTEGREIGLDPTGSSSGPIAYWEAEDIAAKVAELTGVGWQVTSDPKDVGGGMLVARLSDGSGSTIGLRQGRRGGDVDHSPCHPTDDPEFRAAVMGYAEWGTRLAMHNSSDADDIVEHAPVPRWGWGVAPPYQPTKSS